MITFFRYIVLILAITVLGWNVNAQSERVRINPFSQELLIGEQTRVELTVYARVDEKIIWPEFTDTVTTQIEIIESHPIDTIFEDSISKQTIIGYQKQWVISSFDSGLWAFPETTVWIDSIPFSTNSFLLAIGTVDVDTAKGFIDIVEPIQIPMTLWEYIQAYYHYPLIGIGVLFALAILAFIIGKNAKKEGQITPKISIPAHITALERLNQLESEQLWQSGAFKAYHIQISDIIREYIENRFHVPVKESTTDELKHLLKITRMDKNLRKEVLESLGLSDLVKFAKATPLPHENEDSIALAYKLVDQTKIVEEIKEESSTKKATDNE